MTYNLTLAPDALANLVILALIACIYFDSSGYSNSQKDRLFLSCFPISLVNINIHIVGLICIYYGGKVSLSLTSFVLTTDLIVGGLLSLLIYRYLIIILHQNTGKGHYTLSIVLLYGIFVVYLAAVFLNLKTGWIFSFDASGALVRGKLYLILLYLYVFHFLMMFGGFITLKNRAHHALHRLAAIGLPVCLGATIVQLAFPEISFNALYGVLALFIIFISTQQSASEIDSLTSVYTRSMLNSFIELNINKKQKFYILAVKIEQFQQINMRFGSKNGDSFIKEISDYMKRRYPKTSYRMKGVTFAIIFQNCTEEEYRQNLDELMGRFEQPWQINSYTESLVNASFADLIWSGEENGDVNMLLANIEYALSILKGDRERNYLRFDKSMKETYDRRESIIQRLKVAHTEEDAFRFTFQPIFKASPETSKNGGALFVCTGAEALLRMNDSDGTPLSPAEFVPIAEITGQVHDISYMTLAMACDFLNKKALPEDWFLTLNVSAHQFVSRHFIQTVIGTLEKYKIKPGQLKLEITEYTSLVNEDAAMDHIALLHRYGIGVFLDDFGTGYSNLFAASHLPLECVKIDKSLLQGIHSGSAGYGMLQAFISGFAEFKIPVLVEGIEEEWQSQIAYEMGAAMIQGYHMSHPLEEEEFLRFAQEYSRPQ